MKKMDWKREKNRMLENQLRRFSLINMVLKKKIDKKHGKLLKK